MDGRQFDDLLRSLPGTRRAALATLLAAMGGLASLPVADAKKRKKKKKGCRGCRACTACVKGKCVPVPDRTACGGDCQECMGGQCVNKAAGELCGGTNRCRDGICNAKPSCHGTTSGCKQLGAEICCSGVCDTVTDPTNGKCVKANAGQICDEDSDCQSNACVGYRCQ